MKRKFLLAMVILISLGLMVGCGQVDSNSNHVEPKEKVEPNTENSGVNGQDEAPQIVIENEAFKIYEPRPEAIVRDKFMVKGIARVWEATVQYEFEDGHFILDKGFVTASEGAPGWGEFEIEISLENAVDGSARVILFEQSAKDGSRLHELIIPVEVEK